MADDINIVISVEDRDVIRARKHQNKLQAAVAQLEKEYRKGNITHRKYLSELNKQASALAKLGGSYNKAKSEVFTYAATLRKATDAQVHQAQAMAMAKRGMNKFGMVSQQVGYQVGDFFVQVQSGTSALVAFGQQGTQLAGLIPGIGGAIIGIGLAIGTMVLRTRQQMNAAEDTVMSYKQIIKELGEETKELVTQNDLLASGFKSIAALRAKESIEEFNKEIDKLSKNIDDLNKKPEDVGGFRGAIAKGLASLGAGGGAQDATKFMLDQLMDLREKRDALLKIIDKSDEEKARTRSLNREREQNKTEAIFYNNRFNNFVKEITRYQNRVDAYQKYAESRSQSNLETRVSKEQQILANREDPNIRGARELQSGFGNMVRFIDNQLNNLKIKEDNLNKGLLRQFQEYAESRLKGEASLTEQLSKQYDDRILRQQGIMQGEYKTDLEKANLLKETTKQFELQNKEAEDRIKLLEIELDYGQDSLELEKAILQQERWRKIEAAREAKLSEGMIHVLDMRWTREMNLLLLTRKQREEKEKLLELEEQRLDFEKKIEGFLESGFMSMIDGTKSVTDAFRSMARDVIKELYRILVVQQIVNQAKTAITSLSGYVFPSANGNAFNNGKIIPYANGGVVGSPTMFPMSGGNTGLMGEAGPEAILPLKRGPDGKLGVESSGGSVVVNQTINVSTGVVQTVRNEIKTLMPQIAEGAKSAVLDAKRRGGSFGSAFA